MPADASSQIRSLRVNESLLKLEVERRRHRRLRVGLVLPDQRLDGRYLPLQERAHGQQRGGLALLVEKTLEDERLEPHSRTEIDVRGSCVGVAAALRLPWPMDNPEWRARQSAQFQLHMGSRRIDAQ